MRDAVKEIKEWFESCGYEVEERVGLNVGEVDRFAVRNGGLVPSRTWWTVAASFPQDLDAAVSELDRQRASRGADRALMVVTEGLPPPVHSVDLNRGTAHVITRRYLALVLAGIVDEQTRIAQMTPELHFPCKIEIAADPVDALVQLCKLWVFDPVQIDERA